ncbi:SDR family NAD(P)-dependent oxidoreductase [Aurantimicrobium minutum]|uniref:SDR family NAD(P)-dependent oxidoreductase n=1 Tax=Aurantimicrobium minutum TaxID=708131 RepID=UPI0024733FA4|nr:SDR family oxidoreductase [Aurantimicrobium minutum]MDH6536113.1 NAD(P)-dependent dehydrogenase (short-subunit alcohol dehydrogenase family) [Aurantimicrobium minutum]
MTVNMSEKNVIVTGAGGGIGRATSLKLAEAGANLVLVDFNDELVAQTLELVKAVGVNAITIHADVTKDEEVKNYVEVSVNEFGTIDGFYNNAGIEGKIGPVAELDKNDWDKVVAVNLTGVYLGMRYVLPVMIAQGSGSVVCTGSIASTLGLPQTIAYNAAKHGVAGIVRTAAAEVAKDGVRVNAVAPGMINTRMLHDIAGHLIPGMDKKEAAKIAAQGASPMGRLGEPEEIANVVRFLLSDESSFMTGAIVAVDGGTTCTASNDG